jgi:hypothetical protein
MKDTAAQKLAETFAHMARNRIDALFHETSHNTDRESYRLAQQVTGGGYDWLDEGMLR